MHCRRRAFLPASGTAEAAGAFPLRTFDAETLARLLTCETETEYAEKDFDRDLSDEETVMRWEAKKLPVVMK